MQIRLESKETEKKHNREKKNKCKIHSLKK